MNHNLLTLTRSSKTRIVQTANAIKTSKSIVFLSGAGISVASGIPDFRSPGGMYDTLRPELLTASDDERQRMKMDPTYVVSKQLFQKNPFPYLELRRPFIVGINKRKEENSTATGSQSQSQVWKPTIAHLFMRLVDEEKPNCLTRILTQNIDGLDYQVGLNNTVSKIISVHGSIGKIVCEFCGYDEIDSHDFAVELEAKIRNIYDPNEQDPTGLSTNGNGKVSQPILCPKCNQPGIKPSTVLYGSMLPQEFNTSMKQDLPKCDLLIVMGTSLTVQPASLVPEMVGEDLGTKGCTRILVNKERVGFANRILDEESDDTNHATGNSTTNQSSDNDSKDIFLQGDTDEVFLELIIELGWTERLKMYYKDLLCENSKKLIEKRLELNEYEQIEGR